jgi:hypothetical protein
MTDRPFTTQYVLDDIMVERERQDAKWGVQEHTADHFYVILGEEFGEVGEAILDMDALGEDSYASRKAYRKELTHVAAVAVAAIEKLDRDWMISSLNSKSAD